ncbi:MAG: acyl carrier protein [Eubacteriales bacterium]|nr:acyl carrier protein [Eubacteriales bacterium]
MEFEKLQHIIAEVLSLEPEEITREMTFVDDLGADSLEVFQIVMGIEDAFDVILEEDVVNQIKTVEDAFALVNPAKEV